MTPENAKIQMPMPEEATGNEKNGYEVAAEWRDRCKKAEAERDQLRAQLPEGMRHCTIEFHECEKGHGWLTATNWVPFGCPACERDQLRARVASLEAGLEGIRELADDELRRLGAIPGSNVAQIEANANAALLATGKEEGK